MRTLLGIFTLLVATTAISYESTLLDQDFRRLASDEVVNLGEAYAGKVVLVVNTASKCGNTPQYDGLEKLYEVWGDEHAYGLRIRQNVEDLERVLKVDTDEADEHFHKAWEYLQGAESRRGLEPD